MPKYRSSYRRRRSRGFTFLENIIIVVVIGVMAVISVPSFLQMLDSYRLDQSITHLRSTFSAAQRQAIRDRSQCEVGVLLNQDSYNTSMPVAPSIVDADCLPQAKSMMHDKTVVMSNLIPLRELEQLTNTVNPIVSFVYKPRNSVPKDRQDDYDWCIDHEDHGHEDWYAKCRDFEEVNEANPPGIPTQIAYHPTGSVKFGVRTALAKPSDPSGKIILYNENQTEKKQKCLVISRRLGLTRKGNYNGQLNAQGITDNGTCRVEDWSQQ